MSLVCLIYLQSTGRGVTHFSNCSDFNLYSTPEFCKLYQYVPHQDQICQQKSTHSRFGEKSVGSKSGAAGIWNVLSADILSPRISLATLVLGYSICPLRICGSWLPSLHHTDPSATATANRSLKPQNSEHYPPQQVAMICNAYNTGTSNAGTTPATRLKVSVTVDNALLVDIVNSSCKHRKFIHNMHASSKRSQKDVSSMQASYACPPLWTMGTIQSQSTFYWEAPFKGHQKRKIKAHLVGCLKGVRKVLRSAYAETKQHGTVVGTL